MNKLLWTAQKINNIAVDNAENHKYVCRSRRRWKILSWIAQKVKNIVVDRAEIRKYCCGSHRIWNILLWIVCYAMLCYALARSSSKTIGKTQRKTNIFMNFYVILLRFRESNQKFRPVFQRGWYLENFRNCSPCSIWMALFCRMGPQRPKMRLCAMSSFIQDLTFACFGVVMAPYGEVM